MSLDDIKAKFRAKIDAYPDVKTSIKFDLGDDGVLFIDTTQTPAKISNDDSDADTVLVISKDDLDAILNKTLDPRMAFMTGKLKVKGSMNAAMQLTSIL